MKFIDFLQEEYCARYKDVEIFVNPSKKELQAIVKVCDGPKARGKGCTIDGEIRFLADNRTKKLFVWPAYQEIHSPIATKLITLGEMKFFRDDSPEVFWGVTFWHEDRGMITSSDQLAFAASRQSKYAKDQLAIDWSWLQPYFDISYIERQRKKLNAKRVNGMIVDEQTGDEL